MHTPADAPTWQRIGDDEQPVVAYERPIGAGQLMVLFVSPDSGGPADVGVLYEAVAEDAANRAAQGWRVVSMTATPMRETGTAGNVLFQSGGQFLTQVAVTVVYANR